METGWGSWKFDIENEQLLARVLDKFAADLVLRDEIPPSETVSLLSSLSGTAVSTKSNVGCVFQTFSPFRVRYAIQVFHECPAKSHVRSYNVFTVNIISRAEVSI